MLLVSLNRRASDLHRMCFCSHFVSVKSCAAFVQEERTCVEYKVVDATIVDLVFRIWSMDQIAVIPVSDRTATSIW